VTILGSGSFAGQTANIVIRGKYIAEINAVTPSNPVFDQENRWIIPAFIDSHVHFSYLPKSKEMLDGGICAAVDLASPEAFLFEDITPMKMIYAGPMITSELGYPTQSWGAAGYGIQCSTTDCVVSNIEELHSKGATVIKIPLVEPLLEDELLTVGVEKSHTLGLKVVSHAMNDEVVQIAAQMNMDVLAHCPTSSLSDQTIELWSSHTVITTLNAFGGSSTAIDNLQRFHEAGTTILYGTDFGNDNRAGINSEEIELMLNAGMTSSQIIESATSTPASYWGFENLGQIQEGFHASFLLYSSNPLDNPNILSQPDEIWIDGIQRL
jgi:imidazolonepropionase-like amidohydrolase